jgi:protein ImuB
MDTVIIGDLLDRITNKIGRPCVHRFLPSPHHWPERSVTRTNSLSDEPAVPWNADKPRPVVILSSPETIQVSAPLPDYPPMIFRYNGKVHRVKKSDGPERIECEWWIHESPHRDYYCVENEEGQRYWIFRSGHYSTSMKDQWFIHGFFG